MWPVSMAFMVYVLCTCTLSAMHYQKTGHDNRKFEMHTVLGHINRFNTSFFYPLTRH